MRRDLADGWVETFRLPTLRIPQGPKFHMQFQFLM